MIQKKSICAFDLDGTLDLTDKNLSVKILRMTKKGAEFVAATGRTNNYVRKTCERHGIMQPKFIIADNGGTVFDNREGKYIRKTKISEEKRRSIVEEYIRIGGRLEDIRYTDGEKVYAAEDDRVRKYYEKEDIIKYSSPKELMEEILGSDIDITKITLSGDKKIIRQIKEYIERSNINCWTDIGNTKFPVRERKNHRLDIMDGECSKGAGIKFLSEYTGIETFTCIGNGLNDFSMFKFALDSGMRAIIVQNFENGRISSESEAITDKVLDYANKIGRTKKVVISRFPINNHFDEIEGNTSQGRRIEFARKIEVVPNRNIRNLRGENVRRSRNFDTTKYR